MKVDVLKTDVEILPLAEEWDQLAATDARDGFFRTYRWYAAWMRHIRPAAKPFVITVRDTAGRLVGLAPLCQSRYDDWGFHLSSLGWAGREIVSGDYLDFVCSPTHRRFVVSLLLDAVWANRDQWGIFVAGELTDADESYQAFEGFASEKNLKIRRQEERYCPFISLPRTFDEYLDTLGASTRYNIRRRLRNVEKAGARIECLKDPHEVRNALGSLIQLHVARWQKEKQPGTLGRPGMLEFLSEICVNMPTGAKAVLYRLIHNNSPAAALLAFHYGESCLYYQAGWDPDSPLAGQSPAGILMAQSIRDAIDNSLRYYDFLRGDEDYKGRWAKSHRKTVTLLLARSIAAKQYVSAFNLKDALKHRVAGIQSHTTSGSRTDAVEPDDQSKPDLQELRSRRGAVL